MKKLHKLNMENQIINIFFCQNCNFIIHFINQIFIQFFMQTNYQFN